MPKYNITVPVDYVQGHLRYGHYEMTVESDVELTNEELIARAKEEMYDCGELIVDDYEVNDVGDLDFNDISITEVKNGSQ